MDTKKDGVKTMALSQRRKRQPSAPFACWEVFLPPGVRTLSFSCVRLLYPMERNYVSLMALMDAQAPPSLCGLGTASFLHRSFSCFS